MSHFLRAVLLALHPARRINQRFLSEEAFFSTFDAGQGVLSAISDDNGIPALGNRWYQTVSDMLQQRKDRVEQRLSTAQGVEILMQKVLATIPPVALAEYVASAFDRCFPLRHEEEGMEEGDEYLIRERREGIGCAENLGARTIETLPALSAYPSVTIGYLLLASQGESPDGRGRWQVNAPCSGEWRVQSKLLATMLVYETTEEAALNWTALYGVLAPIFDFAMGVWARELAVIQYRSGIRVTSRLDEAREQLEKVADWRRINEKAFDSGAAGERFLRVGDAIPLEAPSSMAEVAQDLMRRSRRYGVASQAAAQSADAFGDESSDGVPFPP